MVASTTPFFLLEGPRGPLPVWSQKKAKDPSRWRPSARPARPRMLAEYHRLLYVAMTRAKDRLIIAGFEGAKGRPAACWYDMVFSGLQDKLEEITLPASAAAPERRIWRWQTIPFSAPPPSTPSAPSADAAVPSWLTLPAPPEPEARLPLRPSHASLGSDRAGHDGGGEGVSDARAEARLTGDLVHRLLQTLPALPN